MHGVCSYILYLLSTTLQITRKQDHIRDKEILVMYYSITLAAINVNENSHKADYKTLRFHLLHIHTYNSLT